MPGVPKNQDQGYRRSYEDFYPALAVCITRLLLDGFEKRTLKKRKAILDTSLSLFNKYGYKNVTIAQISKQTPVSLETIYNYFGSKDN
ncbi:TetR/AcrR family transcriptional regulator [Clostridium sp. AWRP]|nr:TetR/AcrR family transcriptional regulator [Clostridium sp. AWRP]